MDISRHKTILFQLLKDIYSDTSISPFLGFKGGTAAVMFYNLDRFSVDLDFDLLDEKKKDEVFYKVLEIAKKHGVIKESYIKRYNLFILLSYEDKARNIKIEINRRSFGSRYEMKTYLGVSILTMALEDMFAHKLVAMYERMNKTSRDIYDVWFFLSNRFPINENIIKSRTGMDFNDFLKVCISKLEEFDNKKIMEGRGELLTDGQKNWVKRKLLSETISLLTLRLDQRN
jgi:predicted nucleotidyltransferase component of viral defense system